MSKIDKLQLLQEMKKRSELGGGEKKIAKQHADGKMTARERINALLDAGSFVETDAFMRHRSTGFGMVDIEPANEGVITGYGRVNGRTAFVYAQDFTFLGGSLGEMHAQKICKTADLALKTGAPMICLNDSGGARIQEGVDALTGFGAIFLRNTLASGVIPQISAIMGPCAGGAAYSPALTDFVFMVDKSSRMFITGPQVITSVTGESVTDESLGGSVVHNSISGVAHFRDQDDAACLQHIRTLLSYLPSNNQENPPARDTLDAAERKLDGIYDILPDEKKNPYDIRDIIKATVDDSVFFEVQEHFAMNLVVGFAHIGGQPIGIVANQPRYMAGCLDMNASDKAARFIRFCDCFNFPIINFVDVPGFLPGVSQEHGGIIRHGAKMLYAYSEATVPKIVLVIRKLYGGAYLAMCSKSMGADQVIAWPTAEIAVMGAEGAANIIGRQEIRKAEDPEAARAEMIQVYEEHFLNPYRPAEHGYVDMIIDPTQTRACLYKSLMMLKNKREDRPLKKHGSIPL